MSYWAFMARFAAVVAAASFMAAIPRPATAQVGLERKVLLQQDAQIPGYETVVAEVSIAVGGREGRHSHSGTLVGYILEGELTLELEGQPTKIVKAGEAVLIEPRQVHEGFNKGTVPIKALVTFIVEKGKPLTTPAP
jgi:quercetin dioxygenase-like cupin family protein